MTTVGAPAARPAPRYRVTGSRVLRSEWAKFWSLRSTWITLGLGMLLLVAIGTVAAAKYTPTAAASTQHRLVTIGTDAVAVALAGMNLTQLAIGVLVTAGEYSTGMIRSTLTAVPRRLPVLWSKTAVFGLVTLVLATAGAFASFLAGEHFLAGQGIALKLSSPGVLRCLAGAGVYLALISVLGVALGALTRSVAGGIASLVVLLMLLDVLADLLPASWASDVGPLPARPCRRRDLRAHPWRHDPPPGGRAGRLRRLGGPGSWSGRHPAEPDRRLTTGAMGGQPRADA